MTEFKAPLHELLSVNGKLEILVPQNLTKPYSQTSWFVWLTYKGHFVSKKCQKELLSQDA